MVQETMFGVPSASDEFPHRPPADDRGLPFKDTWYFGLHDHTRDVSLAVHLTLSPNRSPGLRTTLSARWGRRRLQRTLYGVPSLGGDTVSGELVSLRIVDPAWTPAKRLVLSVHCGDLVGEIELAGRFYGSNAAVLTPGMIPTGAGLFDLGHAEQACTATGRLTWSGESTEVDAYAYRDRSWGLRRSEYATAAGFTFSQIHLPDATCGLLGWQHPDSTSNDPMPVGAWRSDAGGIAAATGGASLRGSAGITEALRLEFPGGVTVDLRNGRQLAEVFFTSHEPDMAGSGMGTMYWDQHLAFDSEQGPAFGVCNFGVPFPAEVFRSSVFCHAEPATTTAGGATTATTTTATTTTATDTAAVR